MLIRLLAVACLRHGRVAASQVPHKPEGHHWSDPVRRAPNIGAPKILHLQLAESASTRRDRHRENSSQGSARAEA